MKQFAYIKNKTRRVCRSCANRYSDFFFADESGTCDDCLVNTGHLGFTNLPSNPSKEAKERAEDAFNRLK